MNKTPLTRQILNDYFNFDITDLGDIWRAQNKNLILIQPKCKAIKQELSFFHCKKPNSINSFTDRQINTVEDLQQFALEEGFYLKFIM